MSRRLALLFCTCSTSTCHPTKNSLASGHTTSDVNHHIGRMACQACHLPKYANANDTTATEATEATAPGKRASGTRP